jgi:glucokinase
MTSGLRGGIDLGGAKVQTVVVDAEQRPVGTARQPTPREGGPKAIAETMAAALAEAAQEAGVEVAALDGVGACSPGDVDQGSGTVTNAANLSEWAGVSFPLADELSKRLGVRVRVGNDVNVATLGEFRLGAAKAYDSLLGVFWGTGVGGGLILDGREWTGRGGAGEIGHTVVEREGRRCPCGNRGCMEAYAGRGAMERAAREAQDAGRKTRLFKLMEERGRDRLASGIWERALDQGDKVAEDLMDDAVAALGTAIASAVNLLDVPAVVLGGGMGLRFAERVREPLDAHMRDHLFNKDDPPALLVAELGDLGGAIGAALLVLDGEGASAAAPPAAA